MILMNYINIFNIFIIGKLRIIINYTLHDEMTDNFIIKKIIKIILLV